jgi:hypothetical protein
MKQTLISSTPTVVSRITKPESAIRTIDGEIEAQSGAGKNVGSVAMVMNDQMSSNKLRPITFTFDNSAGAGVTTFLMGDPTGLIAEVNNLGAAVSPTGLKTTHDVFKATLVTAPIAVKSIQYQVLNNPSQFSQNFEVLLSDIDAQKNSVVEDPSAFIRNNQFNDKLLTMDFENPIIFNWQRGLVLDVNPGEVATLTFFVGLAANR